MTYNVAVAPANEPIDVRLSRARRRRDRLLARMTFWEHHRASLVAAVLVGACAVGYGAGWMVRAAFHLVPTSEFYVAVIVVVLIGRNVSTQFDPRKLEMARRDVERLEREADAQSPKTG